MGLLSVPKKYNPPGKHTPMEYPALLTRKEMGLLKSMGGAGKKTRWGVPSFVAPPGTAAGIGNTNTNGSYAGGTKSGNNGPQNTNNPGGSGNPSQGGGSRPNSGTGGSNSSRDNGMRGPVGSNAPSNQDTNSQGRDGGMRGPVGSNIGNNIHGSPSRGASILGMGGQRGSLTAPAVTSMLAEAQRRAAANRMKDQYSQYRSPNDFPYAGAEDLMRNAYMANQHSQYRSPPGNVNAMAPQAQPQMGYQGDLDARARAVSRGPGAVAGVMPGASPLSQTRTLQTLAGSMNDDPRFQGRQFSAEGLQGLARTIPGEAGNESPMGQTAVANTMVNRMALAAENAKKYGYMGGADINKLMGQYDATGMRPGTAPNQGFKSAVSGTDALGSGIASLAGSLASNSQFNQTAPDAIKNATHFYNPDISNPEWGAKRSGNQFTALGNHTFGNAEPTATQVASLRGFDGQPTQMASINPAVAPPQPQQQAQPAPAVSDAPAGSWMDALPGADYAKQAVNYVNETLVQPTQEQIAKYGGFERAGKLAQMAVSVMNFMPGGDGLKNSVHGGQTDRLGAAGDVLGRGTDRRGDGQNTGPTNPVAPVEPPVAPTAPAPANWMYPQYTQAWAGLPMGIGGPIWRPKPPSADLFQIDTGKKKKKA